MPLDRTGMDDNAKYRTWKMLGIPVDDVFLFAKHSSSMFCADPLAHFEIICPAGMFKVMGLTLTSGCSMGARLPSIGTVYSQNMMKPYPSPGTAFAPKSIFNSLNWQTILSWHERG